MASMGPNARVQRMTGYMRKIGLVAVGILAWTWAILAGAGGLALLIRQGPLPITNGWFAMFSGVAACPLTARILKKYAGVTVLGYVQFVAALLIFIAGRAAVVVLLHRPFFPQCSAECW
jgi:hypothetical protein